MDYNSWCLSMHEREEERFEESCLEAFCGHLIAPDERYVDFGGDKFCIDCARDLAEPYEGEEPCVCDYCGKTIEPEEGVVLDGLHYHDECWEEFIDEESECFYGW